MGKLSQEAGNDVKRHEGNRFSFDYSPVFLGGGSPLGFAR